MDIFSRFYNILLLGLTIILWLHHYISVLCSKTFLFLVIQSISHIYWFTSNNSFLSIKFVLLQVIFPPVRSHCAQAMSGQKTRPLFSSLTRLTTVYPRFWCIALSIATQTRSELKEVYFKSRLTLKLVVIIFATTQ